MSRRLGLLWSAAALIANSACSSTSSSATLDLTDEQRSAIVDSVTQVSQEWREAVERADAMGVVGLYSRAEGNAIVRADKALVSFETLSAELPGDYAGIRSQSLTLRDRRIAALSPTIATESAVGTWVSTDTLGAVQSREYAYTRVWVREDAGWRIFHTLIEIRLVAAEDR